MEKGIRDSLVEQQDDEIPRYDLPLNSSLTYVMFGMTILSIACYTVVAPYMPVVMLEKGVDGPTIGYIFAIFSFAVIVGSPLMGSVIQKIGRRIPIYLASGMLTTTFWGFAAISLVDNKIVFILFSMLLRLMQGIAFTLIQVTCLSIAATFYPSHKVLLIGYLEAAAGAGMFIGPLIGTGFFAIFGYRFMMVGMGVMFFIGTVIVYKVLDEFLDDFTSMAKNKKQALDDDSNNKEKVDVTAWQVLKNPTYLLCCLSGLLGYFIYDYMVPILGLRMLELGLTQSQVGLFFCLWPASYVICSIFVSKLPKSIDRKVWIILGLLLSFFIQLMIGPSETFGIPINLYTMGMGQLLQGAIDPLILVFILPEMIDVVERQYPNMTMKQKAWLADHSSGVLNSFLGVGQVSGPVYAAFTKRIVGFRYTCDGVAFAALFLGIVFIIVGDGASSFRNSKFK